MAQVGGGGDQVSFIGPTSTDFGADQGLANLGGAGVGFSQAVDPSDQYLYNRGAQYANNNPQYGLMPVAQTDPSQGAPAQAATGTPGTAPGVGGGIPGGGGMSGGSMAPIHHTFKDYQPGGSQFGQLISDPTYVQQKAALLAKLGDYERNVASQVGDQNLSAITNSTDPLTGSAYGYNGRALPKLYNVDTDVNGDNHYKADMTALGGTLGKNFDTSLGAFDNQQANGLRSNAEDYAARGMLGSGSGVWQTARNNLQNQYNNQLTNLTDSTTGQYNNILAGMNDQFSQGRNTLSGYATDASNRLASGLGNLPTSV